MEKSQICYLSESLKRHEISILQLMYLGAVSTVGSLVMALILEESTMPSSLVEWMLLLLTGVSKR